MTRGSGSPLDDKRRTPGMFDEIAHRYDLLNRVLSVGVDRGWRRELVRLAGTAGGGHVLDAATGTADVAIEFARSGAADVVGIDASSRMLSVGREKIRHTGLDGRVRLVEADALAIPFADGTFDAVAIAFGLRNLTDYARGLAEMTRVLAPGGRLLVLEFFPPRGGVFLHLYRFYLRRVLPAVGRLISGSDDAYRYLADSIETFLTHDELRACLADAGLEGIRTRRLSGGIACITVGVRP